MRAPPGCSLFVQLSVKAYSVVFNMSVIAKLTVKMTGISTLLTYAVYYMSQNSRTFWPGSRALDFSWLPAVMNLSSFYYLELVTVYIFNQ